MRHLILAIIDSLRYDYFIKADIPSLLEEAHVFKCWMRGASTLYSVPIILTGKASPRIRTIGSRVIKQRLNHIVTIQERTLFDYFKERGYEIAYINIDRGDSLLYDNRVSLFPSLPWRSTCVEKLSSRKPLCLVFHIWSVHYPYGLNVERMEDVRREILSMSNEELRELYFKAVLHFKKTHLKELLALNTLLHDSMLVLLADHGEMLGENDRYFHEPPLTRELGEVPLCFIHDSFKNEAHDELVQDIDILPTILDIYGIQRDNRESLYDSSWLRDSSRDE